MPRENQGSSESRFDSSEKNRYCLKIPKWQHELVGNTSVESWFLILSNAAKTCSYGLKISENIDIKHAFQSKAFFISVTLSTKVASAPLIRLFVFYITENGHEYYES